MCLWLISGFLAGLLARALMPGEQRMGIIRTTLLGVAGSFVGGALSAILTGRPLMALNPAGFIGAVIGALVLLGLGVMTSRR